MRLALLSLLICAAAAAQEHARWIADLGDPERSEAAEVALVQLGERAAAPLAELFPAEAPALEARELERLRAALRVLALLGPDAVSAAPALAAFKPDQKLLIEVLWTRGCFEPWSHDDSWQQTFHQVFHEIAGDRKGQAMDRLSRHMTRQQMRVDQDTESLLSTVAADEIHKRCLAAEMLGRKRADEAIEPLRARLLDRGRQPVGWDQMQHNGFVLPVDDGFRFSAGEAMLAIAPTDPRCAVALGCRALLHPHRSVRKAALDQLAGLGASAADALDELMALARGDDKELAVSALKLLGMAGDGVADHLAELERLAKSEAADVAARARSLVARLRATGAVARAAASSAAGEAAAPDVAAAVAKLADPAVGDAVTAVRALGKRALPVLVERLRKEHEETPAVVVQLLGEIGHAEPGEVRERLRQQVLLRVGDHWQTQWMSSTTGSQQERSETDYLAAAGLSLQGPLGMAELTPLLANEDPYVRLQAALWLADGAGKVADAAALRVALVTAARDEHPRQVTLQSKHGSEAIQVDIDRAIQGAAVAAAILLDLAQDLPPEVATRLLQSNRTDLVLRAVAALRGPLHAAVLEAALADARPAVAVAAATAVGSAGAAASALLPALERAAGSTVAEVAAAARAALVAVRGGEAPR